MKSQLARRPARSRAPRAAASEGPELCWNHDGIRYRVTLVPDVRFERETDGGHWIATEPTEEAFAATALGVTAARWRNFTEYLPRTEREFACAFEFSRLAALHVIAQCPALLPELVLTPALTPFIAAHLTLRGGDQPAWAELGAVFERDGIFGVLQWLGLPASRQTLTILQNIADPDLPRRLLEPLRAALWEPEAIWVLSRATSLTDEQLVQACHALAA